MSTVTLAPITSTVHRIATELPVGGGNGLSQPSAVKCDQVQTIPIDHLHEPALHEAIRAAFDLV